MSGNVDIVVLSLRKPVSPEALGELGADATRAVEAGASTVAIDVDDVGILDSRAISTLIAILRNVRGRGASVELRASRKSILDTLRITALDKVFTVSEATAGGAPVPATPLPRKSAMARRGRFVASVAVGAFAAASFALTHDAPVSGTASPASLGGAPAPVRGNDR